MAGGDLCASSTIESECPPNRFKSSYRGLNTILLKSGARRTRDEVDGESNEIINDNGSCGSIIAWEKNTGLDKDQGPGSSV